MLTTTTTPTAVLYDPHPLWIHAMRGVLLRVGVEVVGAASEPWDAVALVREHRPTLFVTEVDAVGTAHLAEAHAAVPALRSVVLSASANSDDVAAAFTAGASAYALKSAHPDDVATAVRQAFMQSVFTTFVAGRRVAELPAPAGAIARAEPAPKLTRRQREILRLVAEGRSNGEVARLLWVTEQTVKFHLANVYRKLRVANRTEASRWAHEQGLLAEPALAA
jgi:DNA-binding NarL/FixJ family response regulator